jgi:hypothetical protein
VTKVVNAREVTVGLADRGGVKETANNVSETDSGVRAPTVTVIPSQRGFGRYGKAVRPTGSEVTFQQVDPVGGEGKKARLVELGFPNEERSLARVVVADSHPEELPTAETCRVEESNGQAEELGPKGADLRRLEGLGAIEQLRDLIVRKDVGLNRLVQGREECRIGNETGWLASAAI